MVSYGLRALNCCLWTGNSSGVGILWSGLGPPQHLVQNIGVVQSNTLASNLQHTRRDQVRVDVNSNNVRNTLVRVPRPNDFEVDIELVQVGSVVVEVSERSKPRC